ncbi:inactive Ufm1-specific protease 1 [Triplophysa dalaica]|uniref:inactive Ufm1-specific protease 1 n=1 Tax=Triplophysa dalaica TaxID=1582913 RepID=UPI0024DF6AD3|nr:inactive Ufm1-specific protease 1 [Triplophysa dalaica]XP_056605600.1 inactive Ufm1-specific protease 1 [Triplophysa dalaica]
MDDTKQRELSHETEGIDWGGQVSRPTQLMVHKNSWSDALVKNAHEGLNLPSPDCDRCSVITGECLYYHYGCDGKDDRGWGCGYRTLQTIASWLCLQSTSVSPRHPPNLSEIQQTLIQIGDKPKSFLGSREWIGTIEAVLVLDQLYDVPCRIVHVRHGKELVQAVADLHNHFCTHGSPVMMGGDRDNSSKGILGVCTGTNGSYLLVMDPHYFGCPLDKNLLQKHGWVSWKPVGSLDQCSFYNLCLPLNLRK